MDDMRTSKYENGCIMKLLRGYTAVPILKHSWFQPAKFDKAVHCISSRISRIVAKQQLDDDHDENNDRM